MSFPLSEPIIRNINFLYLSFIGLLFKITIELIEACFWSPWLIYSKLRTMSYIFSTVHFIQVKFNFTLRYLLSFVPTLKFPRLFVAVLEQFPPSFRFYNTFRILFGNIILALRLIHIFYLFQSAFVLVHLRLWACTHALFFRIISTIICYSSDNS